MTSRDELNRAHARLLSETPISDDATLLPLQEQVADFIRRLMVDRTQLGTDSDSDVRWSAPETADHPPLREGVVLDVNVDGCRYILTRTVPKPSATQDVLSPREQEISRMIAKGYPNKTIASVLDISAWTVCTHLRRIFAKLGVSSRAAMVARLKDEYPHMFGNGFATE